MPSSCKPSRPWRGTSASELVAEGIETVEQHQFLREHGCTLGQGYLFSLPLAAEDLAWVLSNHTSLPPRPPPVAGLAGGHERIGACRTDEIA
jgi:predicted signal transduction protein with EAL and GGDEF domain